MVSSAKQTGQQKWEKCILGFHHCQDGAPVKKPAMQHMSWSMPVRALCSRVSTTTDQAMMDPKKAVGLRKQGRFDFSAANAPSHTAFIASTHSPHFIKKRDLPKTPRLNLQSFPRYSANEPEDDHPSVTDDVEFSSEDQVSWSLKPLDVRHWALPEHETQPEEMDLFVEFFNDCAPAIEAGVIFLSATPNIRFLEKTRKIDIRPTTYMTPRTGGGDGEESRSRGDFVNDGQKTGNWEMKAGMARRCEADHDGITGDTEVPAAGGAKSPATTEPLAFLMIYLAVKRFEAIQIGVLIKLAAFLCCGTRYTQLYETQKKRCLQWLLYKGSSCCNPIQNEDL
ncbi:hypothetical protein B0H19DRAFT_1085001 [Mycena capillaripes]|nr:hypothetical protein B0H19DRAFT_1085001 [Mycena capillaripes]